MPIEDQVEFEAWLDKQYGPRKVYHGPGEGCTMEPYSRWRKQQDTESLLRKQYASDDWAVVLHLTEFLNYLLTQEMYIGRNQCMPVGFNLAQDAKEFQEIRRLMTRVYEIRRLRCAALLGA